MWLTSRTVIPTSGLAMRFAPDEPLPDIREMTIFNEIIFSGSAVTWLR